MRHLLGIAGWRRDELEALLDRAQAHLPGGPDASHVLRGRVVANLFFEDSTRTRSSFEVAARKLGADVLNWSYAGSSVSKGETLLDTARNIEAMGPAAIIIRHRSSGAPSLVARHVKCAVVNAGDGAHEHPSQALLDAFTLRQRWGALEGRTVLIVGDVLHSRVARSNLVCLKALGARVVLCGPPTLLPPGLEEMGGEVTHQLDAVLPQADAVMCLRLQTERMSEAFLPSQREYSRLFGLTPARAERMKPDAPVLHPGPINRGVELSPAVADGPRSVILDQVANGVAVRRAILEVCAS
ncbi:MULTISPECIES: aspartate carbamoyltransferase catalytic subunit [Corallococcus]|uniref:aspartate carbamoyltransferase catalytic subunit n=1 Tax=Corallococcus TaxID=83461 RepID=UPI00117D1B4D|nr:MULTISPECIES: aspartate carbamoyltransferase catalytic subunit [Corallococcus]NBD09202.1 aspartate carbamoyltransferase catalytic subunit [Corallococcus silvisoli]TSC31226.1 aspartate carbamoyltransferase catalytic subunit [Corallococcus sp. Z5C101001]